MTTRPAVEFRGVSKTYGASEAVREVSFTVPAGSLAVLLGPSGCGKTTLLKMVNRLLEPTGGQIVVSGRDTREVEPTELRRGIGYVIQQVGLFPHLTVTQNVAVVPELLGWERTRIHSRVQELLQLVGLPESQYGGRYPAQLSGGQQQRVGIARALGADPALLLMDEPFGALDAIERARLQAELATLHRRLGKTILFVTHDVDEALRLADLIVVMRDGRVVQAGTPLQIVASPADEFVSQLIDAHDLVRRLMVLHVRDALLPAGSDADAAGTESALTPQDDLRTALSQLLASSSAALLVRENGKLAGRLTISAVLDSARRMTAASS